MVATSREAAGTGLSLTHEVLSLPFRDPFRIARSEHGAGRSATTVIVELRDPRLPGVVGYGEGYPDRFYGETVETMVAIWPYLLEVLGEPELSVAGLGSASARLNAAIRWNGAAKCALDSALHDLVGKAVGQPVHRLLGLTAEIPPTDFTIGIDAPDVVAQRAQRAGVQR